MTLLGCIADDFTGATDIAGILARSGRHVSLRIGAPQGDASGEAPFEVIALKVRSAPLDSALRDCRAALEWLQKAGAERFFWKYCSTFDSTPKGNIGPIAEMLMDRLAVAQTIYCPAFPENGRTVYKGHLFVGDTLLAESPMKDHPLTPMTESDLVKVLTPQVTKRVGLAALDGVAGGTQTLRNRLSELAGSGIAHVVTDAVNDADLATIAEACRDMVLVTGGSALARTLPALWADDGRLSGHAKRFEPPVTAKRAIVLSGSCSAMTNRQVAVYDRGPCLRLDPITLAREGSEPALTWLDQQSADSVPMICATAEPDQVRKAQAELGKDEAGRLVEEALADCALHAFSSGFRRFVVTGGETSGAVTTRLDVDRLDVGEEIAPGVPWCFSRRDGESIALALKSGNFGSETFFAQALDMLE